MLITESKYFESTKKQLIELKKDFEVIATKYTKRININDKCAAVFSDSPTIPEAKTLINYVRNDAEVYKQSNIVENIESLDIKFYDFLDKKDYQSTTILRGKKIDLNEAYWQTAKNIGLISEKTDLFLQNVKLTEKMKKELRLKSLGSLATRQTRQKYEGGKMVSERMFKDDEEQERMKINRIIYLRICEAISLVMSELVFEFFENVIYYYWDCIFIDDKIDEKLIIEKINKLGYNAKTEDECSFQIEKLGDYSNLISTSLKRKDSDGNFKVVEYPINK